MPGTVHDTYVAALQHDLVDLPEGTHRVGVVRRPTSWFHGVVDENVPALGPPESLLEAAKERQAALEAEGHDDATAHDRAWQDVEFGERYREHLETDDAAVAAVDDLLATLREGTDVALVCYENTDEKRCHRTILRAALEERLESELP